jgi:hypothetical protein
MTIPIIIAILAAVAVVAWVWFGRRRALQELSPQPLQTKEQPVTKSMQSTALADVGAPKLITANQRYEEPTDPQFAPATGDSAPVAPHKADPATSVIAEPVSVPTPAIEVPLSVARSPMVTEPAPVVSVGPVVLPPTSPSAASQTTNETPTHQHHTDARETETSHPSSASPPASGLNNEAMSTPSEAVIRPQTEAQVLISDSASHAGESASQTSTSDETCDQSGVLLDKTEANTSAAAPKLSDQAQSKLDANGEPPPAETEPTAKAPIYQPPKPPASRKKTAGVGERASDSTSRGEAELHVHLKLKFGRGVVILALVPDWRVGMPDEVDITGTQGKFRLVKSSGCYEDIPLVDASKLLRDGVEWRGSGAALRWRWVMGGRELYVLTSGDVGGLYPFGSSARLVLKAKHVVLTTMRLRESVEAAMKTAGCSNFTTMDEAAGIPFGWLLFRDVLPTISVPQFDERNVLNPLCPTHEVDAHFIGGVRLKHRTWLAGYPPRIRFSGQLGDGFKVTIDGQSAQAAIDGSFEAPGWGAEGRHRLEFGQKVVMYAMVRMHEDWDHWNAHDFGTGAMICGASTRRIDGAGWRQVRIPAANPLLVGARPGEIFYCNPRHDVRSETILAMVPFTPVWALPIDPVHADKRSAHLVLLDLSEPVLAVEHSKGNRRVTRAVRLWVTVINNAGRKQLGLSVESDETKGLWRRYRAVAKQLWRKIR